MRGCVGGGGWVVGGVLPFGTLDYVRTIFFLSNFSVVRCLAYRGNDFKTDVNTFEVIFELLGPKYKQKSTLLRKLVSVI